MAIPMAPYIFKGGKHQGKSLENLFFDEYSLILWMLKHKKKLESQKMLWHLDFSLAATKNLEVKAVCPLCKNKATHFLVSPGNKVSLDKVYCGDVNCLAKLRINDRFAQPYAIRFEVLNKFQDRGLIDRVGRLFKLIFGLPSKLHDDTAYNYFREFYPKGSQPLDEE